jgi:response regulator RpfG family c-di-GMP phosphodiesterase
MSDLHEILGRSELFKELTPESLERIRHQLKKITVEKDGVICREGEPGDSMYIVTNGKVSVLKELGWGQRELRQLHANEIFGEMALITNEARSATVKALERTDCLQLNQQGFADLIDKDSLFAQRVAKVITMRLSALDKKTSDELLGAYKALMFALADLTDSRDPETGAHLERTRNYCALLAEMLSSHPKYKNVIHIDFISEIYNVSPMHDIGKVAIPDSILLKPERLTKEEYEVMKTHTTAGADAFNKVLEQCDVEIFRMAHKICLHHHEKWDGTGYPTRLAADDIPIEARIMAMADVYDALLSKRVYKPPLSYEVTRQEVEKSAGTFFDPVMTRIMLDNIGLFEEIHKKYSDS